MGNQECVLNYKGHAYLDNKNETNLGNEITLIHLRTFC